MGLHTRRADRLALLVAASIAAILAREAEARQGALDRRLRPMRTVINALERLHGADALPLDHPHDFTDLVTHHSADHLRARDVQLLPTPMLENAECRCAHSEALDDLAVARQVSGEAGRQCGERSLLARVGVSKARFPAEVETALRHLPRSE